MRGALSERLLSGIDWEKIENVLEPQAGKGNIVRTIMERYAGLRGYSERNHAHQVSQPSPC